MPGFRARRFASAEGWEIPTRTSIRLEVGWVHRVVDTDSEWPLPMRRPLRNDLAACFGTPTTPTTNNPFLIEFLLAMSRIQRAIVSVTDKTGLVEFACTLAV